MRILSKLEKKFFDAILLWQNCWVNQQWSQISHVKNIWLETEHFPECIHGLKPRFSVKKFKVNFLQFWLSLSLRKSNA